MGEGEGTFYTEWEESFESFDQMGLHENLLRGIYAYGAALSADCSCSTSLAAQPCAYVAATCSKMLCSAVCCACASHRKSKQ